MAIEDQNIITPMLQSTAETLKNDLFDNSVVLKKSARKFIRGLRKIMKNYHNISVLQRGSKVGIQQSLNFIYDAMKKSAEETRQGIKLQYDFEQALNTFLGRQIFLLYITQDGKLLYADQQNAAKIYQTATSHADGKGSIKDIDKTQLTEYPNNISKEFQKDYENRQKLYNPIREQVTKRWTQNHNPENFWVKKDKKLLNTFYWKIGTDNGRNLWNWSKSINRGHISEAYAYLIWQEKSQEKFDPKKESDIGKYWYYMDSHKILNSVAGIVQGDVSFFQDSSIQFAVKSGSFNTAAMGSYIDVAYQLAYGQINITTDMVKTLLKNLPQYSYQVRQNGRQAAEKKLNELIQKEIKGE